MVDQHPRPEAERSQLPARLPQDDAPDLERPLANDDLIIEGDVELGQQLRPDQRTAPGQQPVVVGHVVLQHKLAIERKRRLNTAQLDDPRDRLGLVRRAGHAGDLHRRGARELRFAGQGRIDDRQHLVGPRLTGRDEDVGRRQRAGFRRHRDADALDEGA